MQLARAVCTTLLLIAHAVAAEPADGPSPHAWGRWEHALISTRAYKNPYADVELRVRFTGPDGSALSTFGFWDGGNIFRIRCAFPKPGTWRWQTECSDVANDGLHQRSGNVEVTAYRGDNVLYRRGFLKVSADHHYLTYGDGTPFLWLGDTAWATPMRATDSEWEAYLADRRAKHFTVIQIAPAPAWSGPSDRQGHRPFTDKTCAQWNPDYWQAFEQKVQRANEAGFTVMLVGLMEPVSRYPDADKACLFARNIVARLFGNFVSFSPSFDSNFMPLANEVGRATRAATAVHLITQHPGTPSREPLPTYTMKYFDESYLDIAGVQTGHNRGDRERCAHHAIEWIVHASRHTPPKPVINLEAMYDGGGDHAWQAVDARAAAWRSWLSGAKGYTYGAGDVPPKTPPGTGGGIWKWVTDPEKPDYWKKVLQWDSSRQMQHLHDFLSDIEWWRLDPAHDLIRNQPDKPMSRRMVLAKTATGDLAVAYLPDSDSIEVDLSTPSAPLAVRWFDPVRGRFDPATHHAKHAGIEHFTPPSKGEWVLLLQKEAP